MPDGTLIWITWNLQLKEDGLSTVQIDGFGLHEFLAHELIESASLGLAAEHPVSTRIAAPTYPWSACGGHRDK
jgi:hypothetical protein